MTRCWQARLSPEAGAIVAASSVAVTAPARTAQVARASASGACLACSCRMPAQARMQRRSVRHTQLCCRPCSRCVMGGGCSDKALLKPSAPLCATRVQARCSSDASSQSHTPSSTIDVCSACLPSAQWNRAASGMLVPSRWPQASLPGSSVPSGQSQKPSFTLHVLLLETCTSCTLTWWASTTAHMSAACQAASCTELYMRRAVQGRTCTCVAWVRFRGGNTVAAGAVAVAPVASNLMPAFRTRVHATAARHIYARWRNTQRTWPMAHVCLALWTWLCRRPSCAANEPARALRFVAFVRRWAVVWLCCEPWPGRCHAAP